MFWAIMKPNGGGEPTGALASAIQQTFGSFNQFKAALNDAGVKRFGSGWTWLVLDQSGQLSVISTANQDSPFMSCMYTLMGNFVSEHTYNLIYPNSTPHYSAACVH